MNKNIGDMTNYELMDFIIELQEENSRYERKNQKYKEVIDKAIEYIEKDYSYTKRHDIPLLTKDEQLAGKLLELLKEVE